MATETPIERAEWGLRRQWAGDFGSAAPVLAALEAHGNEVASAWVDTLHLSHWLAQPKGAPPTSVTSLRRFAGSSPAARRGAGFACLDLALYHFMTLDLDALRELDVLHGELARGLDGDTKVCRDTVTLYRRALEGEVAEFDTTADDVAKRAATMDLVPPLLAANAMRAYAALVAGNLTAARAIARRASRMSRTEALPQYEYLANTILASVRRRTGNPHLATRILMALAKLAPATWQPWLAWELAWSGNVQAATSTLESLEPARTETPRATSTRWFLAAIESARSGSDGAWQQAE
ncbi:MAG: hypothetical protein KC417_13345, partial [Myxococcales bacterium]|nr:hypothetical protein [Myxococcales bacterium]